jgi:hypothetical protein
VGGEFPVDDDDPVTAAKRPVTRTCPLEVSLTECFISISSLSATEGSKTLNAAASKNGYVTAVCAPPGYRALARLGEERIEAGSKGVA